MPTPTPSAGYSAIAHFELQVCGRIVPIAQVGPELLIVDTPLELAPGPATLIIDVEGTITRREIELPNGASSDSCRIAIKRR